MGQLSSRNKRRFGQRAGVCLAALLSGVLGTRADARIELDAPAGRVVPASESLTLVAGRLPLFDAQAGLDIVFAIDTSASTDEVLPGPPLAGTAHPTPWYARPFLSLTRFLRGLESPSTLLDQEILLARALLSRLDPRSTRVGVVTFAGDLDRLRGNAITRVPLTSEFQQTELALTYIQRLGSSGLTHAGAGVDRAMAELLATRSAKSRPREAGQRAIVLFTDDASESGAPALARSLRRAAAASVRIDVVIVGEEADRAPPEMLADLLETGGSLIRAPREGTGEKDLRRLRYGRARSVQVHNRTSGAVASVVGLTPDGRFSSLIALAPGTNQLEVRISVEDSDSPTVVEVFEIERAGDTASRLGPQLLAERRRLLEAHLANLRAEPAPPTLPVSPPASPRERLLDLEIEPADSP
ncbi:MAG: VWA domain-containing protein [bacterium]|nr:VWA domain-containing protein [bacterium]